MANQDVEKMLRAIQKEDNVKAHDLLEKILKKKCDEKIKRVLDN